jgi:hypothetical protein
VSANPWNDGLPMQRPSDAITAVSPIRKHECITFSSEPGGFMLGFASGFSLKRISISTLAPSVFL